MSITNSGNSSNLQEYTFWDENAPRQETSDIKKLLLDNWLFIPSVVLCVEQEVCAHNGDADCDDGKDHKDEEHEAVDVVDLVRPERGEDEVPLSRKTQANKAIVGIIVSQRFKSNVNTYISIKMDPKKS